MGVRASGGEVIECDGRALAVGDVVSLGILRRVEIIEIDAPRIESPRLGTIRRARVRWLDGAPQVNAGTTRARLVDPDSPSPCNGAITEYVFSGFALKRFRITGGPKLAAADANPALVKRVSGPNCLLWIGDQIEARQL